MPRRSTRLMLQPDWPADGARQLPPRSSWNWPTSSAQAAASARSVARPITSTPATPNAHDTSSNRSFSVAAPASVHAEALGLLGLWNLLDGSSRDAANLLERAAAEVAEDQQLLAQLLVALAFARLNIHAFDGAAHAADEAVVTAARSEEPQLLGHALAMRVLVRFLVGDGFDEENLQKALQLDNAPDPPSALLWPTAQRAALLIGIGRLDEGRRELRAIRQRYPRAGRRKRTDDRGFSQCPY